MRFQKYQNIKVDRDSNNYQCICCDEDVAVFAPIKRVKGGRSISYKNIFVVSNHMEDDGFKYTKLN